MSFLKRSFLIATLAAMLVTVAPAVQAWSAPAACLLVGLADLQRLPDGSLTDNPSPADQARYQQLTREARARIAATFGPVSAEPILVFFSRPEGFGPFRLNPYGSTPFIGSRACVLVGPQGQNVDVLAHELMHAELHHRVGYRQRWLEIPTWFDEGVAMQLDYRPRYALPPEAVAGGDVRSLSSFSAFFGGDEQRVVRNYAAARRVVAAWLEKVGAASLYAHLERLSKGESFAEVVGELAGE